MKNSQSLPVLHSSNYFSMKKCLNSDQADEPPENTPDLKNFNSSFDAPLQVVESAVKMDSFGYFMSAPTEGALQTDCSKLIAVVWKDVNSSTVFVSLVICFHLYSSFNFASHALFFVVWQKDCS